MKNYPDFVKNNRPKGTIVKKVNGQYYVYKAHSERVPGKKNPQVVVEGLVGKIDAKGFHKATKRIMDLTDIRVREYGFTNYLLMFADSYVANLMKANGKREKLKVYKSLIVYLSENSYLADEPHYEMDELVEKYQIGVPNQITVIRKIVETEWDKVEKLKQFFLVKINGNNYYSKLTEGQKKLLKELEVEESELQRERRFA